MRPVAFIVALALSDAALACDGLEVSKAWVREAPPGAEVMAGYAQLKNTSRDPIKIEGARSPQFGDVQMHRTEMENGQMRMRAEPQLLLEGDSTLTFEPGDLHLMLFEPKKPLKAGDHVTIKFDCGKHSSSGDFVVKAAE